MIVHLYDVLNSQYRAQRYVTLRFHDHTVPTRIYTHTVLEENLQLRHATLKKLLFDSALVVELFKGLKRKLSLRAFINCITYEKILNILKVIDQ